MAKVKLFTDAGTDLPDKYKDNISVLPLYYYFDENEIYDNENELDRNIFFSKLKNECVHTCNCNSEIVKERFLHYIKLGYDILYIGFTSKLSSTFSVCNMVANELIEEYNCNIKLIDSMSTSLHTGFLCMKALDLINQDNTLDEVYSSVLSYQNKVNIYFILDDLSYLIRGGRISSKIANIGNLLNIKLILTVENGEIVIFKKVRGINNALKNISLLTKNSNLIGIIKSNNEQLYQKAKSIIHSDICVPLNLIVSSHMGPDAIGVVVEN